jgi:hypothetical protein
LTKTKKNNFYIQIAPALKDHTNKIEYGLHLLSVGRRPVNGVTKNNKWPNVKTVRIQLSPLGNNVLNELLESHEDINSRLQACRMALSMIDESPKHIKAVKKITI